VIKGLDYVGLTTTDVPRARAFFRDKLGLGTEDDQGDVFSQFTTRHGSMWALMQPRAAGGAEGGVALYLQVEDVDQAYRLWSERGVETVDAPHDEPFGRTFAFKDPDGRVLHAWSPRP
jgi:predicted enzyme related to lactoylglutathione lyase